MTTTAETEYAIEDYRNAPSGEGPLASEWADKPHRLLYDLCSQVSALLSENAGLKQALTPFANFAVLNVNEDGWTSNIHREQISTWFGPSDFRHLLAALNGEPE